jgi:tetratricopeptide (TPR) repeat protein
MQFRMTRLAVVVLALTVAVAGCGRYSIGNIRALKAFSDANKLYQKNSYKEAAARYEDVIALGPERNILGFAYFFLGNSYDNQYKESKKGDPENDGFLTKAVTNYRLAIDTLKDVPDPKEIRKLSFEYLIAAYGTDKLNDLNQAEPIAQQLIALEPGEPMNYQALGNLYAKAGRFDDAEKYFKKAVEVKPKDPAAYRILAGYYNTQGQFEKTMAAFEQGANVEPNNPEAWHTMATYYQEKAYKPDPKLSAATRREYTDKGLADEDKALAINPDYAEALIYKNILLLMKVRDEKDPAKQKAMQKEADDLKQRGMDLMKKQQQAGKDAAGSTGAPKKGGGN